MSNVHGAVELMHTQLHRIFGRGRRMFGEFRDAAQARELSTLPRPVRTPVELDSLLAEPVLVVLAHPDDEVIAAGALMGRAPRAGVITVTNGAPRNGPFARDAGFPNWLDYAAARRREAEAALSLLARKPELHGFIGIPDQEATFYMEAVTWHLVQYLGDFPLLITHAYEGGHPDHDATAFCVHAACALMGRIGVPAPVIVEAPLYNGLDGKYQNQVFLPHADAGEAAIVALTPAEQECKRRMYACHATQHPAIETFHAREESFRVAPRYHFAAPPHAGMLGYDPYGMPVNGRIWQREALKAMRALGLLDLLA